MRRRRFHHRSPVGVELNLAAMLDMAFQLLAFFVLTFQPAPIEAHFQLHLPPPVPLTNVSPEASPQDPGNSGGSPVWKERLAVTVTADDEGDVAGIEVGMHPVVEGRLDQKGLQSLRNHLKSLFEIEPSPFERIELHIDSRLHCEALLTVMDACTRGILPDNGTMQNVELIELIDPGPKAK